MLTLGVTFKVQEARGMKRKTERDAKQYSKRSRPAGVLPALLMSSTRCRPSVRRSHTAPSSCCKPVLGAQVGDTARYQTWPLAPALASSYAGLSLQALRLAGRATAARQELVASSKPGKPQSARIGCPGRPPCRRCPPCLLSASWSRCDWRGRGDRRRAGSQRQS